MKGAKSSLPRARPTPSQLRRSRIVKAVVGSVVTISLLLYGRSKHVRESSPARPRFNLDYAIPFADPYPQVAFWRALQPLLELYAPDVPSPDVLGQPRPVLFNATKELRRPDVYSVPREDVESMKRALHLYIEATKSMPIYYVPGTRGIVSAAGGEYLPTFIVSLRMLRSTGCQLPVELFILSPDEYERSVCEEILRPLNVKCIILSNILRSAPASVKVSHYQTKIFAIIFSSFEELLFLDADSFPISNPEYLFDSGLFREAGLITWPDFWINSAAPVYFEISSQTPSPMNLRAASEAGQIMISKRHRRSLLLATYYNFWGPSHYYPLLSQGAYGEGDKETFLAAALVAGESYYATSEAIQYIKNVGHNFPLDILVFIQHDPVQDHNLTSHGLWRNQDITVASSPRPLFLHAQNPKYNPGTVLEHDSIRDSDGHFKRMWGRASITFNRFGFDVERNIWDQMRWVACNLNYKFKSWQEGRDICSGIQEYYEAVFGSVRGAD